MPFSKGSGRVKVQFDSHLGSDSGAFIGYPAHCCAVAALHIVINYSNGMPLFAQNMRCELAQVTIEGVLGNVIRIQGTGFVARSTVPNANSDVGHSGLLAPNDAVEVDQPDQDADNE